MPAGPRPPPWLLPVLLTVPVLLSACDVDDRQASRSPASQTPIASADSASSATADVPPTFRALKWIDLAVGDCLADPPPSDPSVVTVAVVDCAEPHAAEVYARVPVPVNAAITSVANRGCAAESDRYTGQSEDDSPLTVSYLIDSNQDRTVDNPQPSTVICLLQGAAGQPMTGSARRHG